MVGLLQGIAVQNTSKEKVVSLKKLLNPEEKVKLLEPQCLESKAEGFKHIVMRYTEEEFNKVDFSIPEEYEDVVFVHYLFEGPMEEQDERIMHSLQVRYTGIDDEPLFNLLVEDVVITEKNSDGEEERKLVSAYLLAVKDSNTDNLVEQYEKHLSKQED